MDMIERVARAICIAAGEIPDSRETYASVKPNWKYFRREAVAAIQAMRDVPAEFAGKYFFFDHTREAWKDMVDAILSSSHEVAALPKPIEKMG